MSGGSGPSSLSEAAGLPEGRGGARRYGTIVVVGGGCYGAYYVRQLGRALAAGAIACNRVLVVDRDPECRVAGLLAGPGVAARGDMPAPGGPPQQHDRAAPPHPTDPFRAAGTELTLLRAEWGEFLAHHLRDSAGDPAAALDAVVPSPLMPHLLYEWLLARARARWPARRVETAPLDRPPATPWQRPGTDGVHYVSFAEWMCPINCVEPPLCPEIRGPRTWSMPPALRAYVAAEQARGRELLGPVLFHCTHRAYGVGMIDVRDVLAADAFVTEAGERGPARVLVGTVSHCHGAVNLLEIGPLPG